MLDNTPWWVMVWLLCGTAGAAVTDARAGLIPNWLTLPTLLSAPLVHGLCAGPGALGWALAAALVCGLVPLLLFRHDAIGGGDVKLFAVLGALAGMRTGLELQLTSYGFAIAYALCALAYKGQIGAFLARSALLMVGPFRAATREAAPAADSLVRVRLGVPIFLSALLLQARISLEAWL
jgi:prepilin peptidase CpaA